MEVFRPDVKAGLFIVVGGALFLYTLFRVGGMMDNWTDGLDVTLHFSNAQQVEQGADIYYRGLKVGRVRGVAISEDGDGVEMDCRLDEDLVLLEGTKARVADKSLLGGKMIELLSPVKEAGKTRAQLKEGAAIQGLPPGGLDAMLTTVNDMIADYRERFDHVLHKVEILLDSLNTAATETTTGIRSFAGTKDSLTDTLASYKALAESLDQQVKTLTADVGELLATTEGKMDSLDAQFKSLTGTLEKQTLEVTTRLNTLLENSNALVGKSDAVLTENRESLRASLTTLQQTLVHLEQFSEQIAERPSSLIWKGRKKKKDAAK